jgi:hypothetical protein
MNFISGTVYEHSLLDSHQSSQNVLSTNKKFWEELFRLLSPHKPTVNNLVAMVTMEHKKSKPTAEQGSPSKFELQ